MKKIIWVSLAVASFGLILALVFWLIGGGIASEYEEVRHEAEVPFSKISVTTASGNIVIRKSDDTSAYAVCDENDKIAYEVRVTDGELIVEEKPKSFFAYFGIRLGESDCVVYVPAAEYSSITLKSASGEIECDSSELSFAQIKATASSGNVKISSEVKTLDITTSSGDIDISEMRLGLVSIATASGKINAEDMIVEDKVEVSSSSGAISLNSCKAKDISISTSSGKISLSDVLADRKLDASTSSADVIFSACDAGEILIESSSGEVSGTLLSDKSFEVSTASGDRDVPQSVKGAGVCEIETSSGDIRISILK